MKTELSNDVSRRKFLKFGMSGAALLASGSALAAAEVCKLSAPQTSGPFPPVEAMENIGGQVNPGAKIEIADRDADLTRIEGHTQRALGQVVYLQGRVQDQNCEAVPRAVVHMWQADNHGYYNHENDGNTQDPAELDQHFQYSTILHTNELGEFNVKTIVPKYYGIGGGRVRTAHLHFLVRRLGYETLTTQSYFEGEALEDIETIRRLNQNDIILSPNGVIRAELRDLIVHFERDELSSQVSGVLNLSMSRL